MNYILSILLQLATASEQNANPVRAFNIPQSSLKTEGGFDEQGKILWSSKCRTLFGDGYYYSTHLKDSRKGQEELTIVCIKSTGGVAMHEGSYEIPDGQYFPNGIAKKKPAREAASAVHDEEEAPLEMGM